MKRSFWVSLVIMTLLAAGVWAAPSGQGEGPAPTAGTDGLLFIQNVGQFDAPVRFYVYGAGYTAWLSDDALWITLVEGGRKREAEPATRPALYPPYQAQPSPQPAPLSPGAQVVNLKLSFPQANPQARLEPVQRLETVVNYYQGRDRADWHAQVPVWQGVRYTDLYPGVDLEVTGEDGTLAWRLLCQANCPAALQDVQLRLEGADRVSLDSNWLRLSTAVGEMRLPLLTLEGATPQDRPAVSNLRPEVFDVSHPFSSVSENTCSSRSIGPCGHFWSQDRRPQGARLQTDQDNPAALLASTFLGGEGFDGVKAIALDPQGAVYVTGFAGSTDIYWPQPPGVYELKGQSPEGRFTGPIFVAKFNADLSDRTYMTFIGDRYQSYDARITEVGHDIAVDAAGNAYVTGQTLSLDQFPVTEGAFDTVLNDGGSEPCSQGWTDLPCTDGFVAKLNAQGWLDYATYLGGSYIYAPGSSENWGGDDYGTAIAVDQNGHVYVTGRADSQDFPTTPGAYDRVFADVDIGLSVDLFVVKLNPAGNGSADLMYGTYVGTGFPNRAYDITVDQAGLVYVAGETQGEFPVTANAYDPTFGGELYGWNTDAVFFKLDPAGNGASDLVYSTYLGGDSPEGLLEGAKAIWVGDDGTVYLGGSTDLADFPHTPGAFMGSLPPNTLMTAFVSKLTPAGAAYDLAYSTFLGGGYDIVYGITADNAGHIYVTGETLSAAFPTTPDAFDTSFNYYYDAFVTRLNPAGEGEEDLVYSTYLGSGTPDDGQDIALAGEGVVYVVGQTASEYFPTTPGAYDTTFGGGYCGSYPCDDGFVSMISAVPSSIVSGRVLDGDDVPIEGVCISAGETYSATTDASGAYSLTLPSGSYILTPSPGYFWTPQARLVDVPPSATGQDFVGRNVYKQAAPTTQAGTLGLGDRLTYTLRLVWPQDGELGLYDPLPPLTYTRYLSGSLDGPGLRYDSQAHAISGRLDVSASQPLTVSFAVEVKVMGTAGLGPALINRACVYPVEAGLDGCRWSNRVIHYTYLWPIYLPVVQR